MILEKWMGGRGKKLVQDKKEELEMKITVEAASGYAGGSGKHDIYLNGEIKGWLGVFGKVEIERVPEGENIITIITDNFPEKKKNRKEIRLTSTQDVHIWVRKKPNLLGRDVYESLVLGEDVKVIEEKEEKMR